MLSTEAIVIQDKKKGDIVNNNRVEFLHNRASPESKEFDRQTVVEMTITYSGIEERSPIMTRTAFK